MQVLLRSIQKSVAKLPHGGKPNRIVLAAKFALRRLVLRFGDRAVRHTVGDRTLCFPFSHNYPIDTVLEPRGSTNLSRIAGQANAAMPDFALIDVGANVGDTVAELRMVAHYPILAVEGDETYYGYLRRNVGDWPDVTTARALLGEEEKEIRAQLVGNYGGSKQIASGGGAGMTVRTLDALLYDYPDFRRACMLKIDTDGYDLKIIRGARQWLEESRPVIFFEYDPHHLQEQGDDGPSIFPFFRNLGYRDLLLFEGNGDFMFSGTLDDERFLDEMHACFTGRASKKYADLCVFPEELTELFERCREEEMRVARHRRMA